MVDPQALNGVKQVPEPLSPKYRNRVPKLSNRSRSHSVKYVPGSYSAARRPEAGKRLASRSSKQKSPGQTTL